ncbi:MAG: 4-oxalocrotonate decarboxylase [Burkholderiales bacterium]|nr:4-oxalocrotonate decarboxylase [Burkholderiales bacterium]MDE1925585.1 4-oxalocrotonate decarboxylase [Burkholderiales bacterium]MDE2159093.1 4-oxalocrotonate decarboxylase [Burkholderiales bacterium]MDE2503254.1 4-oxalocrotonate decarboxylase [Burkholderiales bacterium]
MSIIHEAAALLDDAAREHREIDQFPAGHFTLAQAYEIQRASIQRRIERGERHKGIKLGFTSRAKMVQMGVDSLIWGLLTDGMLEEDGGSVDLARYIHPRVEPEVCFVTRRVIDAPLTSLEAADYLEAVAPAMEIIDSRYRNFKFSLEGVVADNCSSAGLVVGAWSRKFDGLANAGVRVQFDGRDVLVGSTGAILGQPLRSVVQASHLLHAAQMSLPAGSLVMAGGATAAVALTPGLHVQCRIGSGHGALGCVAFTTR